MVKVARKNIVNSINNKLLIISGPTATGKTKLAISLAKKFKGELISADSRQIYQHLNIGTGKDHPKNIKIHLIDLIAPDKLFSVSEFQQLAFQKISEIKSQNKLPIIVGGTGFYIDSIINPNKSTFHIKPNKIIRYFFSKLPLSFLQFFYKILDQKNFNSLNNSEKNNPHRLIRKIEIKFSSKVINKNIFPKFNILHINLTAPNIFLYSQIDKRVDSRLQLGLLKEIKNILKKYSWSSPGLNTLAYKEFKNYFRKKSNLEECIERWKFDEHAYARRQLTWFRKYKTSINIDITGKNYINNTKNLITKWYNKP